MFFATFTIGNHRFENQKVTDISEDWSRLVIQIDGDKHVHISLSRCEYVLEITQTIKCPTDLDVIKEILEY